MKTLVSRMITEGLDIEHYYWNRVLSLLSVTLTNLHPFGSKKPFVKIEKQELARNPEGVLAIIGGYSGDIVEAGQRFIYTDNGFKEEGIDEGGITLDLIARTLHKIREALTTNAQPEPKQKALNRESLVKFTLADDGLIPGKQNFKQNNAQNELRGHRSSSAYKGIGIFLATCATEELLHTGPLFSIRVYEAILRLDSDFASLEKKREIYEILNPEESITILPEDASNKQFVNAFRRHYSDSSPPEQVGGWNVDTTKVAKARDRKEWYKIEQELRVRQQKNLYERDELVLFQYDSLEALARALLRLPCWDELKRLTPLQLSERIEGSKEISPKTILERIHWYSSPAIHGEIKQWMASWLEAKKDESSKEHKKRLLDLLQAITGGRALPFQLYIDVVSEKSPEHLPEYSTCSKIMECPKYPDENTFREKLEKSLPYALQGFYLR